MVDGPRPTYENVGPLVAAVDDLGGAALVTFRCPATGTEVKSQGEYPKPGIADKVGRVARAGALDRARIGLVRTVQRTAGTAGTLGLAVGETAARKGRKGRPRRCLGPRPDRTRPHGPADGRYRRDAGSGRR